MGTRIFAAIFKAWKSRSTAPMYNAGSRKMGRENFIQCLQRKELAGTAIGADRCPPQSVSLNVRVGGVDTILVYTAQGLPVHLCDGADNDYARRNRFGGNSASADVQTPNEVVRMRTGAPESRLYGARVRSVLDFVAEMEAGSRVAMEKLLVRCLVPYRSNDATQAAGLCIIFEVFDVRRKFPL